MTTEAIATDLINEKNLKTLELLASIGGRVEDELGFATRRLFEDKPDLANGNQGSVPLRALETYGLIARNMKGKRTYSIELTELGQIVASRVMSMLETPDPDPNDLSNEQVAALVAERLVHATNHDICNGNITKLNAGLDEISSYVDEFEDGKATWLDTFQGIKRALERTSER